MRNLWKSGVCETGGGEREVAAAPREADSNMQLSRVRLHSTLQSKALLGRFPNSLGSTAICTEQSEARLSRAVQLAAVYSSVK